MDVQPQGPEHAESQAPDTRPSLDIQSALERAIHDLTARLGARGGAIYLLEGEEYQIRFPEGCGVADGLGRLSPGRILGPVFEPLARADWPEGAGEELAAAGWLGLGQEDSPVGAALLWWEQNPELPNDHDLRAVAEEIGARIETSRLFLQVERAKRQWEATVDALREGIAVVDVSTSRILRANWALARYLKVQPADLVGRSLGETVLRPLGLGPGGLPSFDAQPLEMEVEAQGQTWRVVQYKLADSKAGVVIFEDVTERHRSHQELVRAHRKIQESMERLRSTQAQLVQSEKMAAVGQLVSGVAHELNNPLTSVLGFSQLLQRTTDEEKRQAFVEIINKEAERARKIVQNLLTFARKKKPEKAALDLNEVVRQTIELKAYEMKVSGIQLATELADGLPRTSGDFQQLQQVLLNLIQNAVHAVTSSGANGCITVRTRLRRKGEPGEPGVTQPSIVLEVEDNGPGIPEAHLHRIFEPFYTTKAVGEGTGLGLSLSYGIVQEHGGAIRAESGPGEGARFVMEFPVMETVEDALQAHRSLTTGDMESRSFRILVVDDEESIRTMLRELLEGDGHLVRTASDGNLALETIGKDEPFDLILTDLKMPVCDGYDLFDRLRRERPGLADRVVFITGDTVSQETRNFLLKAGARFLPKPLNLSRLREVVSSVPES